MTATEKAQSAPGAPETAFPHGEHLESGDRPATGRTATDRAWADALAYAQQAGTSDPEAFADDYAAMIEDRRYETRSLDEPLPTPAEFVWP
ncbi:hypothetical protein RS84_00023 [Microbacterium hydrocarbonoxydans]|uniref:Uncharacterized protein n=1 Tax=Microbacterium hydrocarbonoxydans TaxID=273678 RepID=A0A0M2HYQ1_9MICO|nr:hypothetical protein RS84_00023 [Microbacterium hydrocarbonoxydans]